jgi:NCAIR mutase (PurE)-related protein
MNAPELQRLLEQLARGEIDAAAAHVRLMDALRARPFEDLGFARVDHHRSIRQGFPEVVLGLGKTPAQIAAIAADIVGRGSTLMVTRASEAAFDAVRAVVPGATYYADAAIVAFRQQDVTPGKGTIVVAAAGTSDLPVAEEAARTAELMGNEVQRLYDVGVAGLHRLLSERPVLPPPASSSSWREWRVRCPASFRDWSACPSSPCRPASDTARASGIAALLGMLNSCSAGVSVVNIDNGFGAANIASLINHL